MPDMTIKVLPGAQEKVASGPFNVFLNTPQYLKVWENFPNMQLQSVANAYSNGTLSFYPVPLHMDMSLSQVACMMAKPSNNATFTMQWGLYSNNAGTLSLANSASRTWSTAAVTTSWLTMVLSATSIVSPGPWYFAFNILSAGTSSLSYFGLSSIAITNANVSLGGGRITASTNAMPANYAISNLDITGADAAHRFPYVIATS